MIGELPTLGEPAPDFQLVDANLANIGLDAWAGKKKLISIVPSLDTPVCATSTKKFNEAAKQRPDAAFLVISSDLPFAMSRFCLSESAENVSTLSMMRSRNFAKDYGILIEDGPLAGITARAVIVLDAQNTVLHSELVPEIAEEPNYDEALAALDS
ncbi:MAG: thiol peroxidase [Candidatus Eutrophobiaceae bacterium]